MITFTHNGREIGIVKVDKDAYWFEMDSPHTDKIVYALGDKDDLIIDLPPGTWSIIGKGNEIDWTVAVTMIDSEHDGGNSLRHWYRNYEGKDSWIRDPVASLHSRIRSLGHIPDECLLIEKIK